MEVCRGRAGPELVCTERNKSSQNIEQELERICTSTGRGYPKFKSACLSPTQGTSGGPAPNSPACSPRRKRRQVFRALFPACDVSLRIVRPSCTGLRPWNNGDRLLGVGARSALASWALGTPSKIQAHSPHSGYRQARPCPGKALEGLHLGGPKVSRAKWKMQAIAAARGPRTGSPRAVHLGAGFDPSARCF